MTVSNTLLFIVGVFVVGALVVVVVVLALLWIWGRGDEDPPIAAELWIDENKMETGSRVLMPAGVEVLRQLRAELVKFPEPWYGPHPYDWAHRERALAADHYITAKPISNAWEHEQPRIWVRP